MRTSFYPFSSIVQCPWVNFKSDIQIFPNCTIPIDKVVTKLITSFSSPSLTNNLYQVRSGCNIFYLSLHNTWSNAGVGGGVGCIIHNISLNSLSLSLSLSCSQHILLQKICSSHFNIIRECKFTKSQISWLSTLTGTVTLRGEEKIMLSGTQ